MTSNKMQIKENRSYGEPEEAIYKHEELFYKKSFSLYNDNYRPLVHPLAQVGTSTPAPAPVAVVTFV